jgi:hypothetical protein
MEFLALTCVSSNLSDAGLEIEKIVKHNGSYLCEVPISPKQLMRPRIQSLKKNVEKFSSGSIDVMWPLLSSKIEAEIENLIDSSKN